MESKPAKQACGGKDKRAQVSKYHYTDTLVSRGLEGSVFFALFVVIHNSSCWNT